MTVAASSSFCTLAGAPYSWAPPAPRPAPVSRSATTHDRAVRFLGTGGASGGTTSPAAASASPPSTGREPSCAGTGDALGRGDTSFVVRHGSAAACTPARAASTPAAPRPPAAGPPAVTGATTTVTRLTSNAATAREGFTFVWLVVRRPQKRSF